MNKILIIDDDTGITDLLNVFLSSTYDVAVENDGLKALDAVMDFVPDLILLDLNLPGISGREIASRIVEDTRLQGTPIVFITGELKSDEETEIDGHPFISKPIDFSDLLNSIQNNLPD